MTKQEILNKIETEITSNGLQKISGVILNTILTSIAEIIPDDEMLTSSFGGIVKPSDIITVSPGIGRWFIAKDGVYTNYGGFTFLAKNFNILSFNGTNWDKAEIEIPNFQISDTFDPLTTLKAQGGKQIYDAASTIVDNAFLQTGGPLGVYNYGTDTNYTNSSSNSDRIFANNFISPIAGKLTKITINIPAGRNGVGFLILQKIGEKKFKTIKYFEKQAVLGVNVFTLNYNVPANCTVAMVFQGQPAGYTSTGGNGYMEFSGYNLTTEGNEQDYVVLHAGYLPFTFEVKGTGVSFSEGVTLLKKYRDNPELSGQYRTFDVTKYGAKGDGITDDRVAIQNTINACFEAGGGKVYFPTPSKFYWLGTELTAATEVAGDVVPNTTPAQLIIPANTNTSKLVTIEFIGEYKVNMADEAVTSVGRSTTGFIKSGLVRTANYDGAAIFGTRYPSNNLWLGKNYIHVHMENLIIRSESMQGTTNIDNFVHGINFERLTQFTFNYIKLEKSSVLANSVEPTKSIGIICPSVNNKAQLGEGSAFIAGWYAGVQMGEHFNAYRLILLGCVHGISWPISSYNNTYHSSSIMHLNTECCKNVFLIQGGGKHVLNVFNVDVEHHGGEVKWYNYVTDIVKSGTTDGSLNIFNYQVVKSGIGNSNEFITQGNPTYKILTGVGAN
jgi:Pectate lyase superfamily protein